MTTKQVQRKTCVNDLKVEECDKDVSKLKGYYHKCLNEGGDLQSSTQLVN